MKSTQERHVGVSKNGKDKEQYNKKRNVHNERTVNRLYIKGEKEGKEDKSQIIK